MRLIDALSTRTNIIRYKHITKDKNNLKTITAMAYHEPVSFLAGIDYGMELAFKVVANEPTAYDPDKIVEQLEEKAFEMWDEDNPYTNPKVIKLDRAIEIVKSLS